MNLLFHIVLTKICGCIYPKSPEMIENVRLKIRAARRTQIDAVPTSMTCTL